MRRLFAIFSIAVLAVLATSCYDDSKIFGELSNLGDQLLSMNDRLTKVENDLAALQGDINALAELSQALKSGIYIKSVTALADGKGYTITFSDDRNIVVKNGESDAAPDFAVGVMTVDGKLVWAVNGVPLKNGDKYVEVYAATPIFQVNDKTRKLEVSYDNGNTWVEVGEINITVEGGDNAVVASCIFSDVKVDENAGTVTFTLTEDGSKIVLPLSGVFELVIEAEKIVRQDENSAAIPYMVKGADETTVVRVFTAGRCNAEVRKDTILVTNVTGDREILVYADNCKGKTSIKQVKLTRERFSIYTGNNWVPYEGGQVTTTGVSNIDFEVRIPETIDWITLVETKVEEFSLTFDVAQNETSVFREGIIDFVRKGTDEVLMSWVIYQDANPNVANTISSAEEFIAFLKTVMAEEYNMNEYFLTADIDLSNIAYDWNSHIVPIYNSTNTYEVRGPVFKGTFNGDGHKITGFNPNVELPEQTTFGLFPVLCYGTIKNLDLTGEMTVSANNLSGGSCQADAGMLVGTVLSSTIQNVTVNGKIYSPGTLTGKGRLSVGGVCGYAFADMGASVLIENAVVNIDADISAEANTSNGISSVMYGGVVGFSTNNRQVDAGPVFIQNCINNGDMNVNAGRCGGIIATAYYGTNIVDCVNNGNQVFTNARSGMTGGIASYLSYSNMTNCVNNGNIDATASGYNGRIGGLVSYITGMSTISEGGNYGIVNTLSSAGNGQYRGLLWAYLSSNQTYVYDVDAGGKLIIDGIEQDVNINNYMDYIGYTRYPENLYRISWMGNKLPESPGIADAHDFLQFLNAVKGGEDLTSWMNENGEVVLAADIDLSGVYYDWMSNVTSVTNSNNACTIDVPAFNGVFDGQNHKITGFNPYVQLTGNTTFGLFPVVSHGTIKNLELFGQMDISATGQADAGMLVGTAYNSTIQNVTVNGKIVSTGSTETKRYALGGAVGFAFAQDSVNTVIENVVVNVEADAVGGNNAANGATAAMYGGIVGFSTAINAADQAIVIIKDCVNNCDMNVTLGRCSGIVPTANTGTTIQGCTNNGDQVNKIADGRLGNIVCNMSHYCNVIDCVNNGDLDATREGYKGTVGGLIALAGSANGCTISGGGNYGTIRTVGTAGTGLKYVGLLWANHNNRIPTSGVVAGGKIIVDGIQREINESNYMEHIGYIRYPEFVTDITWGGSDNPSESDMPTIREFAQEYVKIIDVWKANKGTVNYISPIGVIEEGVNYVIPNIENVNYLPADTKIIVAGVEHTLPQAFDIAMRSYLLLRGYDANNETVFGAGAFAKLDKPYDMDAKILAARPYLYGSAPYNEAGTTYSDGSASGNGGELKMGTPPNGVNKVKVDLLDNFAERNANYATLANENRISNLSSYTKRLEGYYGCASAMRMILTYAYFFKYMLDNRLVDAASIAADVTFDTALFGEPAPAEPEQPEPDPTPDPNTVTIKEFMTEYVKLIDVWQSNVGTVNVTAGIGAAGNENDVENAHYIPDDTKLKVGEVEYNLADALEVASRSYLLLRGYDGNDTKTYGRNLPIAKLAAAYTVDQIVPETHAYTWGSYPYAERTNGGAFKMVTSEGEFERCKIDLLDDYSHRHTNYPLGTGGAISNFCGYTGGYLAGYDGCCCAKRITLAYAYFFKYMLDNNLQDATTISADQVFEAPLFGEPAPAEPEQPETPALAGAGTEADPYVLSTAEHMVQMRTLAKLDATTYFKLDADIDMASVKNWTPVNYDQTYTRQIHIDGNNKTITNFAPEAFVGDDQSTAASYPSLFGVLYGSCKNLTIKDSKIIVTATTPACGFLGGYVGTTGKPAVVENVHIEGEISGGSYIGGFAGQSREGTFKNCTSKVKITSGGTDVGGFIGRTAVSIHLENCTAEVELVPTEAVSGNLRYAGIVGYTTGNSMKVINCSAKGTITSVDKSVGTAGGIVAYAGAGECEVSNCFSDVSVLGGNVSNTGGICGVARCATSLLIQNCYSTGEFEVYQVNAGILSKHEKGVAQIKNCYSTLTISGYSGLGGILGQGMANLEMTMTNCIAWNPAITATRDAAYKYSSGAVAASASGTNTFTGNLRNPALVLTDPFRTIQNHEDLTAGTPEGEANQHAFDGKPAAADATVSSLAKAAGWDETVWDLSGNLPVFKK